MGCSRKPLMKLAPVNGINVCQLMFVPEMDYGLDLTFGLFIR